MYIYRYTYIYHIPVRLHRPSGVHRLIVWGPEFGPSHFSLFGWGFEAWAPLWVDKDSRLRHHTNGPYVSPLLGAFRARVQATRVWVFFLEGPGASGQSVIIETQRGTPESALLGPIPWMLFKVALK